MHEYTIKIKVLSSDEDYWKQFTPPETGCCKLMDDLYEALMNQTKVPPKNISLVFCSYKKR